MESTDKSSNILLAIYAEFDSRLTTAAPLSIAEALSEAPVSVRSKLFESLLAREIQVHGQKVDTVSLLHEYCCSFPEYEAIIRRVMAAPPAVQRVEGIAIPGFSDLQPIRQGATGAVYSARDLALDRIVALKLLHVGLPARTIHRFEKEARIISRLDHPNILKVYAVGQWSGRPYFTMEYAAGGNLRMRIEGREAPFPPKDTTSLLSDIAKAAHCAHESGVIHRDIKPENIVFSGDDVPKLADFGSARDKNTERLTRTNERIGTGHYMSPEQIRGQVATIQSDVYAIGVILYELITGELPFTGSNLESLESEIERGKLEPPARKTRDNQIDAILDAICLQCLQRDPTARYQSAQEVAEDLSRYSLGQPVIHLHQRHPDSARDVFGPRPRGWTASKGIQGAAFLGFLGAPLGAGFGVAICFITNLILASEGFPPLPGNPVANAIVGAMLGICCGGWRGWVEGRSFEETAARIREYLGLFDRSSLGRYVGGLLWALSLGALFQCCGLLSFHYLKIGSRLNYSSLLVYCGPGLFGAGWGALLGYYLGAPFSLAQTKDGLATKYVQRKSGAEFCIAAVFWAVIFGVLALVFAYGIDLSCGLLRKWGMSIPWNLLYDWWAAIGAILGVAVGLTQPKSIVYANWTRSAKIFWQEQTAHNYASMALGSIVYSGFVAIGFRMLHPVVAWLFSLVGVEILGSATTWTLVGLAVGALLGLILGVSESSTRHESARQTSTQKSSDGMPSVNLTVAEVLSRPGRELELAEKLIATGRCIAAGLLWITAEAVVGILISTIVYILGLVWLGGMPIGARQWLSWGTVSIVALCSPVTAYLCYHTWRRDLRELEADLVRDAVVSAGLAFTFCVLFGASAGAGFHLVWKAISNLWGWQTMGYQHWSGIGAIIFTATFGFPALIAGAIQGYRQGVTATFGDLFSEKALSESEID